MPVPRGCRSIRASWMTGNPIDRQELSGFMVMIMKRDFRGTTYRNRWNMLLVAGSKGVSGDEQPRGWLFSNGH
jgi:hypothetical protein